MLLATLCLLASIGASGLERTLHFAFVPHGLCEHGSTVERAHAGHGHDHPASAAAAARDERPTARSDGHEGDGHDHCGFAAVQPAVVVLAGSALPTVLLDWQLARVGGAPTEGRSPIALLELAPKSSPPRSI